MAKDSIRTRQLRRGVGKSAFSISAMRFALSPSNMRIVRKSRGRNVVARTWFSGGTIIDGTGMPPRRGDLLISGQTIAETGSFETPTDARVIPCDGLAVAPGFIDSHSHSDLQVLENRREKVAQGVTAEVVGNCGFSTYPAPVNLKLLHDFSNGIFCGNQDWGWPTARAYLDRAERSAATTVFSLVGHGTLRIACAGNRLGPLAERNLDWMEQMVSESLQQ